jgi:hypothetical protein
MVMALAALAVQAWVALVLQMDALLLVEPPSKSLVMELTLAYDLRSCLRNQSPKEYSVAAVKSFQTLRSKFDSVKLHQRPLQCSSSDQNSDWLLS